MSDFIKKWGEQNECFLFNHLCQILNSAYFFKKKRQL